MYDFIKSKYLNFRILKMKGDSSDPITTGLNALSVILGQCDLQKDTSDEFVLRQIKKSIKTVNKNIAVSDDPKFKTELQFLEKLYEDLTLKNADDS